MKHCVGLPNPLGNYFRSNQAKQDPSFLKISFTKEDQRSSYELHLTPKEDSKSQRHRGWLDLQNKVTLRPRQIMLPQKDGCKGPDKPPTSLFFILLLWVLGN